MISECEKKYIIKALEAKNDSEREEALKLLRKTCAIKEFSVYSLSKLNSDKNNINSGISLCVKVVFEKGGPEPEGEFDILNTKQKEIIDFIKEWHKRKWSRLKSDTEKEIIENVIKSSDSIVFSCDTFLSDGKRLYEKDTDAYIKKFKPQWVSRSDGREYDCKKNPDDTISCEIKNSAEFASELVAKDIYLDKHKNLSGQKKIFRAITLWAFSPVWALVRALNKTFWYLKQTKSGNKKYILMPVKFFKSFFWAFRTFKNLTKADFSNVPNMFVYSESKTKNKSNSKEIEPKYGRGISNVNNKLSLKEYFSVISGFNSVKPLQEFDADPANNEL